MSSTAVVQLPARRVGPLGSILVRIGIALACVVAVAVVVYLERDGYRDVCREVDRCVGEDYQISWLDALYYATVSLSTTGYGDITPVTEAARLVNIVVITPLRFLFLIVLVGTTVEVLTQRSRDEYRVNRWRNRVQDHTVIVGFGVKGRSAAQALIDSGVAPSSIVVVTTDRTAADEATALGCVGVVGDATRDEVLRDAGVDNAARVVVATDRDDTTILVVLTARRLSRTATIVASARESQNIAVHQAERREHRDPHGGVGGPHARPVADLADRRPARGGPARARRGSRDHGARHHADRARRASGVAAGARRPGAGGRPRRRGAPLRRARPCTILQKGDRIVVIRSVPSGE